MHLKTLRIKIPHRPEYHIQIVKDDNPTLGMVYRASILDNMHISEINGFADDDLLNCIFKCVDFIIDLYEFDIH